MRTLDTTLYYAQQESSITPSAAVSWGSTDYSSRLISYTYRETAQCGAITEVHLDNRDAWLTSNAPDVGTAITLQRGLVVDSTTYHASLPLVWVESVRYLAGECVLQCIDVWGKLARYRYASTTTYTAQSSVTIATAILTTVGLTYDSGLTALTLDFTIAANERADRALLRLLEKLPEQAFARLGGLVRFKELDPAENAIYSYGWNWKHPVIHIEQVITAWQVNSVTVNGALKSDGTTYTGSASDSTQIGLVGTRHLQLTDRSLATNSDCTQRAQAELDLANAEAQQTRMRSLPCFGLEIYDVVHVWFSPWNTSSYFGARVGAYEEVYARGTFEQRVRLSQPQRTGRAELDDLPEGLIAGDAESTSRIAPGALAGTQTVGAVTRGGDNYVSYTAANCAAEFFTNTGRPAVAGDALLVYESGVSAYRLYVCENTSTPRWVWFSVGGTV